MPEINRRIARKDEESVTDFLRRAGTSSGRLLGICDQCKACGSTLKDESTSELDDYSDLDSLIAINLTISGSQAGTPVCRITARDN